MAPRPPASPAAGTSALTLPTHLRDRQAEPSRPLMPLDQALTTVGDVGAALQGLCALLHAANGQHIDPTGLLYLLQPLEQRLNTASSDLADMRIVDLADLPSLKGQDS